MWVRSYFGFCFNVFIQITLTNVKGIISVFFAETITLDYFGKKIIIQIILIILTFLIIKSVYHK